MLTAFFSKKVELYEANTMERLCRRGVQCFAVVMAIEGQAMVELQALTGPVGAILERIDGGSDSFASPTPF